MTTLLGAVFALGFYAGMHYLGLWYGLGLELGVIALVVLAVSR